MPRQTRCSTEYDGVYFVKLANLDQSFFIRYKRNGKSFEEKAGRSKQGWNAEKANQLRTERMSLTCATGRELHSNSGLVEQQQFTFSKIFVEYLRLRHKLKGRANDIYRFKNYLETEFANVSPEDVTRDDVERFKHNLQNRNLKPATIRHILELLRRLANFAAKKKLCSGLSFKIQMPKVENYKTEELTSEQLKKLLQVLEEEVDGQVSNLVRLALYTGMRRGELFNLRWSDIDFYKKIITVKSDNKGDNPTIPLNEMAEKVLVEHVHEENDSNFVFPGRGGKKRTECKRPLLRIRKKAGLPYDFRILQGMRHVYASKMASSGKVNLKTLQALLTYKSPLMTRRYAHLLKKSLTNSEDIIANAEKNIINATEEEFISQSVYTESVKEEVLENVVSEEKVITEFVRSAEQENDEAEKEEDYSPEQIDEEKKFEAEKVEIVVPDASKESVEETEDKVGFQISNESTEHSIKVQLKKSLEDDSSFSIPVEEKSFKLDNVFTEFFKQTETLKTQKENVLSNTSSPLEETGITGNVASGPIVEELKEEYFIKDSSTRQNEQLEGAKDQNEIMSNETNHDEITVISIFNVEELQKEVVDNKLDVKAKKVVEATNQSEVMSSEVDEEQNEIFITKSMPLPEKAKKEVVVIQSFKKDFPVTSPTDHGVIYSETKTKIDAENKTQPKVRPTIKELKNDLMLLSKLIKEVPRREKKNVDQN